MVIINLTPHAVNVHTENGISTIHSSGVARLTTSRVKVAEANGIPLYNTAYGAVTGLPESQDETVYIVSALVREAQPARRDLWSPADLVRDEKGNIIGCKSFDVNA